MSYPNISDPTAGEIKATEFGEIVIEGDTIYFRTEFEIPILDIRYGEPIILLSVEDIDDLQNSFGKVDDFAKHRGDANPFENIGKNLIKRPITAPGTDYFEQSQDLGAKGFFVNRAALKMCNLDYIYKLTSNIFYTPWQKAIPGRLEIDDREGIFSCADIASAPGGFTQYVQWRRPDAISYMISLESEGSPKIAEIIESNPGTEIILGPNDDGNIFTAYEDYIERVGKNNVDLSMADGHIMVEGEESYVKKELVDGTPEFWSSFLWELVYLGLEGI